MAIPGYRWVRGLVPEDVYEHALREKRGRTWDDHLATLLGATHLRATTGATITSRVAPAPVPLAASSGYVEVVRSSVQLGLPGTSASSPTVPEVVGVASAAPAAESPTTFDVLETIDDFLRRELHRDHERGIVVGAAASIRGAASVTADSE